MPLRVPDMEVSEIGPRDISRHTPPRCLQKRYADITLVSEPLRRNRPDQSEKAFKDENHGRNN
jgi:hypothetical protein